MTPRRSVSTTLSPADNNDGGVGTVPYSIDQQASHMSAWVGLSDSQQKTKCRQKGRLESTSSMACRLSGHGRVPIPAECDSEKESHVKSGSLEKLACLLSCTSLIPDYHWQHCHCPFANPSPQTPRENHCDPPYTETFPCP